MHLEFQNNPDNIPPSSPFLGVMDETKKGIETLTKPQDKNYIQLNSPEIQCSRVINHFYNDEEIAKMSYRLGNNNDSPDFSQNLWGSSYDDEMLEKPYKCMPGNWPVRIETNINDIPFYMSEGSIIYVFKINLFQSRLYKNIPFERKHIRDTSVKKPETRLIAIENEDGTYSLKTDDDLKKLSPYLGYSFEESGFINTLNGEFFIHGQANIISESIYRVINGEKVDITDKIQEIRKNIKK